MEHMNYDAADLPGITTFAANVQQAFNQDQSVFTARQLDYVKARTYDRKIPAMNAVALIPRATDNPEWVETITYKSFDMVGMAKVVSNYADDLPRVDVGGTERTVRVQTLGDSYGYNINELRASIALGEQLPERKAIAARRAIEIKENQIALVGDAQYGLFGLTNHPNIGTTAGLNGDWAGAGTTAEQIVEDVDTLYQAVGDQSNGTHVPNTLALSSRSLAAMKRKYMASNTGKTAFAVVRENYPDLNIVGFPEFNSVNATSYAVIGEFAEENMALETVMPFNQLPAQARNLELVVPCMSRTGGVTVHYPLAFTKALGL